MEEKLNNLAQEIFNECMKDGEPVTIDEALEMARMELGAKEIKNYTQSIEKSQKKEKKVRTVKISDEKVQIFSEIVEFLKENYEISVETENKLLKIYKNGREFKLNLSETRQKK